MMAQQTGPRWTERRWAWIAFWVIFALIVWDVARHV
jgi:hypothetical protein